MWCVVWFRDGQFVDGRTVHSQREWNEVKVDAPDGDDHTFYMLPEAAEKMKREQPVRSVLEALRLMREMRSMEYF